MSPRFSILNLPAFLYAVFLLYWSLPLAALFGVLKFYDFRNKRRDGHMWATFLCRVFRVRVRRQGKHDLYRDGPCLYLCNHRSWADFFMDTYLTEGRAMLLSRMLVFYVFPVFMTAVKVIKAGILFKRVKINDKEKFNRMIDKELSESPCSGVLVFPEGTRSQRPESLPLRKGMLQYSYSRKMPVQIVISSNKEHVLNEKVLLARFDVVITSGRSELICPEDFPDFDSFFAKVCSTWLQVWKDVYNPDSKDVGPITVPRFNQPEISDFDFPPLMKLKMFLATVWGILLLAVFCCVYVWGVLAVMRALGPLKQGGAVALVVLYAVSFWRAGMIR